MFWGLGTRGLWAAEGRWAEIVREMLLTGDFFHPTIGGEPYFDKPLLTYWVRVLVSVVTGSLSELVVRLPSAVAGLVAVWATMRLGSRLWSARVGRLAGWFLLTTYALLFWSRTGTAEAENLAFIIVAVAWYWSKRERLGFFAMLVFYLIIFVGAMTKGLTAVVVPILVVLPDMVIERRWRLLLRPRHFLAFGIGLLAYLAPFAYASSTQGSGYQSSGLALVFQENILRYFRPFDHKGPIYLYVYQLPVLLLPWTPLFLVAVVGMVKSWKWLDKHTRWLIWAVILMFAFFTLSGSRRSYYILPILPFCALLMAVFLGEVRQPRVDQVRRRALGIQRAVCIGLIAFELAIPLISIVPMRMIGFEAPRSFHIASLGIGVIAVLVGLILSRVLRRQNLPDMQMKTIWPLIAIVVVLLAGYFCCQQTILEVNRTERPFAEALRTQADRLPPEEVAMFPKCNAHMLFYLGQERPLRILKHVEDFQEFVHSNSEGMVIAQSRYVTTLPTELLVDLQARDTMKEAGQPWESKSSRNEKWTAWFWNDAADKPHATGISKGNNYAR
jgi:4-amino-4-deoxy-L-arabinose transferase-like glycosyltransferase